jgi:hypothetical protein
MNQAHYLWHYLFSLPYLYPNCQLANLANPGFRFLDLF